MVTSRKRHSWSKIKGKRNGFLSFFIFFFLLRFSWPSSQMTATFNVKCIAEKSDYILTCNINNRKNVKTIKLENFQVTGKRNDKLTTTSGVKWLNG